MNVIVFGATGGTGRAVTRALAAAGHQVTAFARNTASLAGADTPAKVHPITGDAMRASDVDAAIPGHDAVIVSLGNSQNPFAKLLGARRTTPPDICEVGTRHIIAAMQRHAIARLAVVSAYGIGHQDRLPLTFKLFYRTVLREHMADKEKQEALVKASPLDWTLVQPVGLTDATPTNTWLADEHGNIRKQQITRADVATFLVRLLETGAHRHATVALSG